MKITLNYMTILYGCLKILKTLIHSIEFFTVKLLEVTNIVGILFLLIQFFLLAACCLLRDWIDLSFIHSLIHFFHHLSTHY